MSGHCGRCGYTGGACLCTEEDKKLTPQQYHKLKKLKPSGKRMIEVESCRDCRLPPWYKECPFREIEAKFEWVDNNKGIYPDCKLPRATEKPKLDVEEAVEEARKIVGDEGARVVFEYDSALSKWCLLVYHHHTEKLRMATRFEKAWGDSPRSCVVELKKQTKKP